MKQFLLNPDGSIPAGVNVSVLEAQGITMVLPTPRPNPRPGFAVTEGSPVFDDGMWRQTWVEVELPPPPPPPIPDRVTMRQARLALLGVGLLHHVEPAIEAIADPVTREAVQITWEYSTEVQRSNPFIGTLAGALGMTDADVDNLFRSAALL
jgi:hypothetical protein